MKATSIVTQDCTYACVCVRHINMLYIMHTYNIIHIQSLGAQEQEVQQQEQRLLSLPEASQDT